jgi:hypothetical protein
VSKKVENTDMAAHIQPLAMNGLKGRMLRMPAKGKKTR